MVHKYFQRQKELKQKYRCWSWRIKKYPRITLGEHKGKFVHRLVMEKRIGRKLQRDEHVHHIDGDVTNNSIDNLALVTVAGHARLHRYQDELSESLRQRLDNGRFK
ncbi:HNH endonuclease [Pasteurella multocida]|uniref:HNH endonuclease n=1 Tax=Pasteurella multocida TaxID=747 RepID=UPI000980C0DC